MTCSRNRLDELREQNPELGFAIYAFTPGGPVTLEIHTPDEQVFPFTGLSEQAVLDLAFPPTPAADVFG